VPVPATQPPEGAFPQPPAARLPRASRPLRAADAQQPRPPHTVPLFRSQNSLHRDSVNIRRLGRVRIKARLDPPTSDPAPNLAPPPRRASAAKGKKKRQQADSFSFHPPRFYLRGSRSTRSYVAAFHLEPLRCHLSGFLEKILRRGAKVCCQE